ncbi:hypothetical protein KC316_g59 [Hortaea werneckii]|nr:hypothetical protein KC316_g59 [Hortaea werneckii]
MLEILLHNCAVACHFALPSIEKSGGKKKKRLSYTMLISSYLMWRGRRYAEDQPTFLSIAAWHTSHSTAAAADVAGALFGLLFFGHCLEFGSHSGGFRDRSRCWMSDSRRRQKWNAREHRIDTASAEESRGRIE